jgi:hypothetical protein
MVNVEDDIIRRALDLDVSIRMGDGFVEEDAEHLKKALRRAAVEWADRATFNKRVINLFVDVGRAITASRSFYTGPTALRVESLGRDVAELTKECMRCGGRKLLSVPSEGPILTDPIEREIQESALKLLAPLRLGRGHTIQDAGRLRTALQRAANEWANRDTISRTAANLLVDLAYAIDDCLEQSHEEFASVSYLEDEFSSLVRECVSGGFLGSKG